MSDAMLELAGETVTLLPERALFWPARAMLVVADVHLGKAASFRAHGIPIPRGSTSDDLARRDRALARTNARDLLVLGDLLHARAGLADATTREAIAVWRTRWPDLTIRLVRGNHDIGAGDPPTALGVHCVDEPWTEGPFTMRHFPGESAGYVLAGHVHPAVRLTGVGGLRAAPSAFVLGPRRGLLPAFGSFTGTAIVTPGADDRIFVIAEQEVIEVARTNATGVGT